MSEFEAQSEFSEEIDSTSIPSPYSGAVWSLPGNYPIILTAVIFAFIAISSFMAFLYQLFYTDPEGVRFFDVSPWWVIGQFVRAVAAFTIMWRLIAYGKVIYQLKSPDDFERLHNQHGKLWYSIAFWLMIMLGYSIAVGIMATN